MEPRDPADTGPLQELASELEHELRARLVGARLVMEAGLDDATFERVEAIVRRLARASNGEAWLTRRLPAVLLVHLVGCGSRLETGSFWPTATLHGQLDQHDVGLAFERGIRELGLEAFPVLVDERAHRFLAPILAHGGIPRYAADRYIEILIGTLTRHGMATAAEVAAFWRTRRTALEFGHRPIRRFLLYGGEPALDYLDRSIELVRLAASDVKAGGAAELQLPDHIVDAYLRFIEHTGGDRSPARSGPSLPRPRVALDPFDMAGPYLELPVLAPALGHGTWTVDDGAAVASHRTSAFDTKRVPLAPSLAWNAELRLDDGSVRTSPFEALGQSPYVVFEPRTGSYVDDLRPISLEECWLLAPRDAVITGEDATGIADDVRVLSTLPDPGGPWTGYSVRHLSLEGLASVAVAIRQVGGGLTEGRLWVVAATSRPRLLGEPVAGVTTTDGAPVFAETPRILVPRLAGVGDDRWSVTVASDEGRRTELLGRLGSSGAEVSLAPLLPSGEFGIVDLAIRGPLGSDLRRRFAIVPGINADVPSTVLLPGDEIGRSVNVTCHDSVEVSRGGEPGAPGMLRAPIPPAGDRVPIRVSRGGTGFELAVRFPRLMWALRRRGSLPQLGTHRDRVDADDLIDGQVESLLVSTLIEGELIRTSLENGVTAIHELPAGRTAPPDGRWTVPLAALRDTVRLAPSPRLTLAIDIKDRRVAVADVVATAKAVEIRAELVDAQDGRQLRVSFTEARRLAELVVRLWSRERPWEPPLVAPVAPGASEVVFPADAVRIGRYRAEVAVDDPWFEPRRPTAGTASCADVDVGDPDELHKADLKLELSRDPRDLVSLAMITGVPPREFGPEDAGAVWSELGAAVRAVMADVKYDSRAARPLRALIRLLALEPRQLFEHLASGDHRGFDTTELLRLFLMVRPDLGHDGLPNMPDRVLRPLWRSCPPFAALVDIPAATAGDPEAAARCEENLGWRPDAEPPPVGRRPELAELSLSPARQATLRDMLALVPTALLTWDAYQVACFEWLAACSVDTAQASAWHGRAAGAFDGVSFGAALDVYVEARRGIRHPDFGWADGLRASLACAAHVAVNDGLADWAGGMLEELMSFSRMLVSHDLVLAMAVISPEQAELIRELVPPQREDGSVASDGRWEALMDAAARSELMTASVEYVDPDGAVIARIDGYKGRVKPYERGWTLAERRTQLLPGDEISVVILATDPVHRRLELSVRRTQTSPWVDPGRRPNPGDVLVVTVTGAKPFGLFATTDSGVDGLVHYTNLPDDDLPEAGDEREAVLNGRYPTGSPLRVKVIEVDPLAERMVLSLIDA